MTSPAQTRTHRAGPSGVSSADTPPGVTALAVTAMRPCGCVTAVRLDTRDLSTHIFVEEAQRRGLSVSHGRPVTTTVTDCPHIQPRRKNHTARKEHR